MRALRTVLLVACAGVLAGCQDAARQTSAGAPDGQGPTDQAAAHDDPPAAASAAGGGQAGGDWQVFVRGNSRFALDLYGRLRTEPGNLFFSPGSISTALAMTYAGARAETEAQMADVLHFDLPQDRLHAAAADLADRLRGAQQKGVEVRVANRLWGQAGYELLPGFLRTMKEHYGADVGQVDFVGQTEAARQVINGWVLGQTNNKIQDLIPAGVLDPLTRLVLTGAIYFKGDWARQFNKKATSDAPFHVSADELVDVPMMFQREEFPYGAVEGVQVVELSYAGNRLAMLILLPQQPGGLTRLEEQLAPENLDKWSSALRRQEVAVYLPRFTITSQFSLKSVLESLGMVAAFDAQRADFSGMIGRKELYVSAVLHKAFVDVNEQGTEAAAATSVAVGVTSARVTPTFRADHPFAFLIRDKPTGSILFIGRVANPRQ